MDVNPLLHCSDAKEGETEIYTHEGMRITIVMKKWKQKSFWTRRFENTSLINILFRFYASTEASLSNFILNVRFVGLNDTQYSTPKYIVVSTRPLSATAISPSEPATQQLVVGTAVRPFP